MKRKFTSTASAIVSFIVLTGLFGGCFQPDHRPDNCSTVQSLLEGCPNGFTLFAEINTVTNDPTPNSGTPLVVNPGDILSGSDGCYFKGNKIEPFESNTSLLITVPGYSQQYKCSNTPR